MSSRWLAGSEQGLGVCVLLGALGCFLPVSGAEDTERLRAAFALPEDTSCADLFADPERPGTFGREGLRIEATCTPPLSWSPPDTWSGIPDRARDLHRPSGLVVPPGGRGICWVGVWIEGQSFAVHPCDAVPERYHRHRSAVFDPATGQIHAVLQDLY